MAKELGISEKFIVNGDINKLALRFANFEYPEINGYFEQVDLINSETGGFIKNLNGKFLIREDTFILRSDSPLVSLNSEEIFTDNINILNLKGDILGKKFGDIFYLVNKSFSGSLNSIPVEGSFSYRPNMNSSDLDLFVSFKNSSYEDLLDLIPKQIW